VTEIKGDHRYKRSNDDVTQIFIYKQSCPFLPLNVSSFFKNVEVYQLKESRTGHLLQGDLDEFTKLKIFDVSHNPIEEIQENVFENGSSIESVSFYNCHLKVIDPKILDPLTNLKKVNFLGNICINAKLDSSEYTNEEQKLEKLDKLKTIFHEKCQSFSHNKKVLHPIDDLEEISEETEEKEVREPCKREENLSLMQQNAGLTFSGLLVILVAAVGGMIYFAVKSRRTPADYAYRYSKNNEATEAEDIYETF
jgi:hypothetical protein